MLPVPGAVPALSRFGEDAGEMQDDSVRLLHGNNISSFSKSTGHAKVTEIRTQKRGGAEMPRAK
jgi:hypothetical protein